MKKYAGLIFVLLTYFLRWSVEIPAALAKYSYTAINISKGLQTICALSPGILQSGIAAFWQGYKDR